MSGIFKKNLRLTHAGAFIQILSGFSFVLIGNTIFTNQDFVILASIRATATILIPFFLIGSQLVLIKYCEHKQIDNFVASLLLFNFSSTFFSYICLEITGIKIFLPIMYASCLSLLNLIEYRARSLQKLFLTFMIKGPTHLILTLLSFLIAFWGHKFISYSVMELYIFTFASLTAVICFLLILLIRGIKPTMLNEKFTVELFQQGIGRIPIAFLRSSFFNAPILIAAWKLSPEDAAGVVIGSMVFRLVSSIGSSLSPALIQNIRKTSVEKLNDVISASSLYFTKTLVFMTVLFICIDILFGDSEFIPLTMSEILSGHIYFSGGICMAYFALARSIIEAKAKNLVMFLVMVISNIAMYSVLLLANYIDYKIDWGFLILLVGIFSFIQSTTIMRLALGIHFTRELYFPLLGIISILVLVGLY